MAIVFHCQCGHLLRAQIDTSGKKTRCPSCHQVLTIPDPPRPATAHAHAHAAIPQAEPADDPFDTSLDWSQLEVPGVAKHDPHHSSSGIIKIDSAPVETAPVDPPRPEDGSRQYRVLTQKDQGFTGKFNATKLEEMLNNYAHRGWTLKAAVTMNMPGHAGNHDELIVILER